MSNETTLTMTKTCKLICYGTLMVPKILKTVIGHENLNQFKISNAVLNGYTRHHVLGEDYPAITKYGNYALDRDLTEDECNVRGALIEGLNEEHMKKLDKFEGYEYDKVEVKVSQLTESEVCNENWKPCVNLDVKNVIRQVDCLVYVWRDDLDRLGQKWDFNSFIKDKLQNWVIVDNDDSYNYNEEDFSQLSANYNFINSDSNKFICNYYKSNSSNYSNSCSSSRSQTPKPKSTIKFGKAIRKDFLLSDDYLNLNHGSFGTLPKQVLTSNRYYQDICESNPNEFYMNGQYENLMNEARFKVSNLVNCDTKDLVFLPNTSYGINEILSSLKFVANDEIFVFSTCYYSCFNSCKKVLERAPEVKITVIPLTFPCSHEDIIAALETSLMSSASPKVTIIDAISFIPSCKFPWQRLVELCRRHSCLSLIDAAQEIGQQEVNLKESKPDFWVSSCHKWLFSQRGAAVMYVKKEHQHLFKSIYYEKIKSIDDHKDNDNESNFNELHSFSGTTDTTAYISIIAALNYRESIGGEKLINEYCRNLAIESGESLAKKFCTSVMDNKDNELTSNMVNVKLPIDMDFIPASNIPNYTLYIQNELNKGSYFYRKMSASIFYHNFSLWVRISAQIYVSFDEIVHELGNRILDICSKI